jgi:anti-anti-sigma regulatory factor
MPDFSPGRRQPLRTDISVALPFFGKKPPPGGMREAPAGAGDRPGPTQEGGAFAEFEMKSQLALYASMVGVEEVTAGIDAAAEDAALSWASGDAAGAERSLRQALVDPAAAGTEGLWTMLLDLYRLTGARARFEAAVLDYATRFERSPPPWEDLSGAPARPRNEPVPLVTLAGRLSAEVGNQLQQIGVIARKSGAVRIDLARVRAIDDGGCGLLRQLVERLRAERIKVWLLNGGEVAAMLAAQIRPGEAAHRDGWLLLLELLQAAGERQRFEDLAIEYAITFEESPPSWEPARQTPPALAAVGGGEAPSGGLIDGEVFRLEGELAGAGSETMRRMLAFAAEREQPVVECGRLRRVDFVCAGSLLNDLAMLQAKGREVTFSNVNDMVAVFLRVMGIDQVAKVKRRRGSAA